MTLDELLCEIEQSAFVRYCGYDYDTLDERALYDRESDAQPVRDAKRRAYVRAVAWHQRMSHLASLPLGD